VTSKNIKNGTIQTVDISPRAKKALRGQRGPQGPQGIDEVAVARSTPSFVPPGGGSSSAALCPSGQQPISGGFSTTGGPMTITVSAPDLSSRAWLVIGVNSGTTTAVLSAVAYCAEHVNVIGGKATRSR
jgi:hypothetical protein